jgi:hypothetical protein
MGLLPSRAACDGKPGKMRCKCMLNSVWASRVIKTTQASIADAGDRFFIESHICINIVTLNVLNATCRDQKCWFDIPP